MKVNVYNSKPETKNQLTDKNKREVELFEKNQKSFFFSMTNRIEMIDPAILRRGRFDHVVKVDMPSEDEVQALLAELVAKLPRTGDLEMSEVARHLAGRPLSDVAFVVREAGRLAARQGKAAIAQEHLIAALSSTSERGSEAETPRNIGFIWRN